MEAWEKGVVESGGGGGAEAGVGIGAPLAAGRRKGSDDVWLSWGFTQALSYSRNAAY